MSFTGFADMGRDIEEVGLVAEDSIKIASNYNYAPGDDKSDMLDLIKESQDAISELKKMSEDFTSLLNQNIEDIESQISDLEGRNK